MAAAGSWDGPQALIATIGGRTTRYAYAERGDTALLAHEGATWALREEGRLEAARHHEGAAESGPLVAPMPGTVTVVHVAPGETVSAGQTLLVVEAMKMEHPIKAQVDGLVAELPVAEGDRVEMEQVLAVVSATGADE
jgi:acetyl-CoA/propionyl-CoA carboxylase biotin carboxyl carrier protein